MVISFLTMQGYAAFGTRVLTLSPELSYAITLVVVSIQNFFILMHYVYRSSHAQQLHQFVKYSQSVAGFRLWEYLLFLFLHTLLGIHDQLAILIVQGQSIFLKATVYKKLVFRTRESSQAAPAAESPAVVRDTLSDAAS
jgi:hypothetical protein